MIAAATPPVINTSVGKISSTTTIAIAPAMSCEVSRVGL